LDGVVHLVCRPDGVPVRVQMLPAGVHDLTPVHELAYGLPAGARLLGDKAYNSAADAASILAETGVRLVPVRRANMRPHAWFMDDIELRRASSWHRDDERSTVNWRRWAPDA
jgi:IS5 family transposase